MDKWLQFKYHTARHHTAYVTINKINNEQVLLWLNATSIIFNLELLIKNYNWLSKVLHPTRDKIGYFGDVP